MAHIDPELTGQRAKERAAAYANVVIPPTVREDVEREFFFKSTTIVKDRNGAIDMAATLRNEGVRMAWVGLFEAIGSAKRPGGPIEDTPAAVSATAER
jgi:hypothetical protein